MAGATMTYTTSARSVAIVAPTGPGFGSVLVSVDGVPSGTISLKGTESRFRQVVFTRTWPAIGPHVIELTVDAGVVDVDAFAAIR